MSVLDKYPTLDPELAPLVAAMMQQPTAPSGVEEERKMIKTVAAAMRGTLKDSLPLGELRFIPSATIYSSLRVNTCVCQSQNIGWKTVISR